LVDWNVVPGSTKLLIQEHVALSEIKFYIEAFDGQRKKLLFLKPNGVVFKKL